jgi:hypothetical protein
MQRLELGADFLRGLAEDLPPDPLPVGAIAERNRTDVPVLLGSEVDSVLATRTAGDFRLGHGRGVTLRLPTAPSGEQTSL